MANNNLVVVAIFDDKNSANTAMGSLKDWNKQSKVIKLGAIGTINMDGDELKTQIPRQIWKGVVLGVIVGVIVSLVIGNIGLLIGAAGGAVVGGLLGSLIKKSTNLSRDDMNQLRGELGNGKVAVMATVDDYEKETTGGKLNSLGGKVLTFTAP